MTAEVSRRLASGRVVPEQQCEERMEIVSRCPAKWVVVDLETRQSWKWDDGEWVLLDAVERLELADAIGEGET